MNGRSVQRASARALGAVVLAITMVGGVVSPAGAVESTKLPVSVHDDFSSGSIQFVVEGIPAELAADNYKVVFSNESIGPHVLVGFKIPDGMTVDEFHASLSGPPPEGSFFVSAVFAKPGQQHQKKFDLTLPGTYGYFCPIETPSGTPHFDLGFVGVFDVAPG